MKQILLFLFAGFLSFAVTAQTIQLSPQAEISILTISQGKELYDTFGHSAIRVVDRPNNIDIVYNYGTFDFNTPNFYTKFARGKLLYDLGRAQFYRFLKYYMNQNREVVEQVLELTPTQKQQYFEFLENNAKPENSKYLYDFFFDNCATKLRDVTTEVLGDSVHYNDEAIQDTFTFRDLIYQKLDNHPWGKFGIDIALGAVIDKKATPKQYTFLPEYVYKGFKNATVIQHGKEIPLVKETKVLYRKKEEKAAKSFFTPVFFFSILALLILFVTYRDYKKKKRTAVVDFVLLFATGLAGVIVLLLWFATDHTATAKNYNILWAFMPNLIAAFWVLKEKARPWLRQYFLLLIFLLLVLVVLWIVKVQVFSIGLIPILVLLLIRYAFLYVSFTENRFV